MKIRNLFISAALLSAVILGPTVVLADHAANHTLQQLRTRFIVTFESFLTTQGSSAPNASFASLLATVDESKIKKLEDELQSYQSQIQKLKSGPQTASDTREIKSLETEVEYVQSKLDEIKTGSRMNITRTLQRGSSGNDVKQLQEFLAKNKEVYPEGLATGYFGKLTEDAVKRFQEKNEIESAGVVGPKTRAALTAGAQGVIPTISAPAPKRLLARTLQRGAAGDDVNDVQKLLNRFPDVYPHGSATGFFGPATENAVKKLQEKLGLPTTGGIDEKTQKKINELAAAVGRTRPPKIDVVAPAKISVTTKVTLTGTGFTLENNSLFVKGKTILTGLTSHDGTMIVFSLPQNISCEVGQVCPIKIVNANGISNAKVFKMTELVVTPPAPEPTPPPAPTPEPTPSPCIPVTLNVPQKYPTIQSAIDAATCPGTIIQIASGTYYEILVLKNDITLIGAGPGMTIIDGSKTPATVNPWGYLVQNFNVITAGKLGYGLQNIQIKNLSITGSGAYGDNAAIRIQDSSNVLVENVILYKNTDGLRIYSSSPVTIKNLTFVGNRNGVMSHGTTNVTVKNSIITQNSAWGLYATGTSVQFASAYNAVWGNGTNYDGVASGVGDISLDPRLGGAPQYLVLSGSPTVDAGDPVDMYSSEPLPNCGRINMGSYGNTQWATTCYVPVPGVKDTTPPVRSNGGPTYALPAGTTNTVFSLNTDENAACKYSTVAGVSYANMSNTFSNDEWTPEGTTYHYSQLFGLADGVSYTYYIRCKDASGNTNTDDYVIAFSVISHPTIVSISPSYGNTGTVVKIVGSGFTANGSDEVHFVDIPTDPHAVISNIVSPDGLTLEISAPANLPCSELENCTVFVKNTNGTSNSVSFFRTVTVVPVQVHSPNGGETIVQGQTTTLHYSGGNYGLYVGIAEETATMSSDPSPYVLGWVWSTAPGDRTIGWDGKTLCGFPGCNSTTTKWTISPGKYKAIASSHNEFGKTYLYDPATGKLGNFDLSDGPFSVVAAPAPTLSVVSPNGGEAYKYGDAVTITWNAENIASKSVNIKLLKAGSFVSAIASNVSQSDVTGLFLYNWVVPSTLAIGSDYTIEISDAANSVVKDASDGNFRIANLAALQIYGPNGGEAVMRGFSALLFWTYSGYTPASINVNLYKGGVFYRTLATGVIPVGFSGYSFLKDPYPYNSRYAEVPVALDIPEGNDYTLEIVDGTDSSVLDRSDAPFRIITLPSSVTFTGRMVDALSGAPMPNINFFDWTRISTTTFITGSNGEFSFSADISSMIDPAIRNKFLSGGVPQCNDATTLSLFRYPDFLRTAFGGWFGGLYPASSIRRQYLPVTSSVMNLGDVPMWPSTDFIHTFTDIPSSFGVYYPAGGGGMGNSNYTIQHGLQNTPPLGIDVYVQYKDRAGILYNSPMTKFSTDTRCQIATHSFMNGTYQWEPYPIGITVDWTGGGVTWNAGQAFKITLKTYAGAYYGYSAGTAPLLWEMAFGSLPPGLSLNSSTGEITGTPIVVGTYVFGVKVKDANGVRASLDLTITIR